MRSVEGGRQHGVDCGEGSTKVQETELREEGQHDRDLIRQTPVCKDRALEMEDERPEAA